MSGQEVTDPALIAQLEAQSSVSGDAFLKTLDPTHASQVKAMSEGRMAIPSGYVLKTPYGQQLLNDIAQYDPSFDVNNVGSRSSTRKAFTSGAQSKNITSFNTALGHLGTLAQAAEDLHNSGFPIYNRFINSIGPEVGNTDLAGRVKAFGIAKQAVVEELGRAFKGAAPDVHGTKEWEAQINAADSPEAMRRAIGQAADLLGSRINALQDSYNQGMGTSNEPLPMLNSHARDALAAFQNDDYYANGLSALPASTDTGGGSGPDTPLSGAAPQSPVAPVPAAPSGTLAISDGTEATGEASPLNGQIAAMVAAGKSANAIRQFITDNGGNPSEYTGIDANVEFAKKHPGYTPAVNVNRKLSGAESVRAQIAGSALGAGVLGAANTGLLGTLPKIVGGIDAVAGRLSGDDRPIGDIYDAASSGAKFKLGLAEDAHPVASALGGAAGFIGADAAIGAIPGVARAARALPGVVRPIVGDALLGGLTGAGASEQLSDVPGAVLGGAGAAAAGGLLGRGIAKGAAGVLSPVVTGAGRRLTDAGVTLTPGQLLGAVGGKFGAAAKSVEDKLTSIPGVGDVINATRRGGVEDFNRAAINDALAPIGGKANGIGHAGIADMQQQASDAIDRALAPVNAAPDAALVSGVQRTNSRVTSSLSKDGAQAYDRIINEHVEPVLRGQTITGAGIKEAKQGLDAEIGNLRGQGSTPQDRKLADALSDVRESFLDFADRAAPGSGGEYAAARKAYAYSKRVEAAAAKSKDGVFTPNQFRTAVTKRGYGTTTANLARGSAPMQELSTDASTVLPSGIPDSGTPGRIALGLLATGGVAGGGEGYREGGLAGAVPGALLGAAAFSRSGAKAFQYALAGSRGKTANTLGALIRANADLGGTVTAPLLLSRATNTGN